MSDAKPCPPPTPWYKSKRVRSGIVTLVGGAATALSLVGHFNIWFKVTAISLTAVAAALNQFWALTSERAVQFRKPGNGNGGPVPPLAPQG